MTLCHILPERRGWVNRYLYIYIYIYKDIYVCLYIYIYIYIYIKIIVQKKLKNLIYIYAYTYSFINLSPSLSLYIYQNIYIQNLLWCILFRDVSSIYSPNYIIFIFSITITICSMLIIGFNIIDLALLFFTIYFCPCCHHTTTCPHRQNFYQRHGLFRGDWIHKRYASFAFAIFLSTTLYFLTNGFPLTTTSTTTGFVKASNLFKCVSHAKITCGFFEDAPKIKQARSISALTDRFHWKLTSTCKSDSYVTDATHG